MLRILTSVCRLAPCFKTLDVFGVGVGFRRYSSLDHFFFCPFCGGVVGCNGTLHLCTRCSWLGSYRFVPDIFSCRTVSGLLEAFAVTDIGNVQTDRCALGSSKLHLDRTASRASRQPCKRAGLFHVNAKKTPEDKRCQTCQLSNGID